jgi:acetoin utilization protein AcuB
LVDHTRQTEKEAMEMLVKEWMNTHVITVKENTPMAKAPIIMKEKRIRTLPVVNKAGRLVGIITDRDLKDASPSKATTLNVYELNFLISRLKIKDIMSRNLVLVRPDETLEFAALLMLDNKISALPVTTQDHRLVGIITQTDIFRALVDITGVFTGGIQFAFRLEDRPGSIKEVADEIRLWGARIVSILSTEEHAEKGYQNVYIRIHPLAKDKREKLSKALEKKFTMLYSVCDYLDQRAVRQTKVSHWESPSSHYGVAAHIGL